MFLSHFFISFNRHDEQEKSVLWLFCFTSFKFCWSSEWKFSLDLKFDGFWTVRTIFAATHIFVFSYFYSYFHIFISCCTPRTKVDTKDIFIRKKEFTIFWKDAAAASQQKSCWNFSCCKLFCSFSTVFTISASFGAPISDLSNFYISSAWSRRHSIWLCDLSLEMRSQEGVCHLPQGFSIQKVFFSLTSYIAAGLHKHSRRPWGGRTCKAGEVSFCIILDVAGDTAADVKESESNSGRKEGGCHKSSCSEKYTAE